MKKFISTASLSLIILLFLFGFKKSGNSIPIGSGLPKSDLLMKDGNGKGITMKSEKGKEGLLVMFSCNTCPYVIKNQARTKAICSYAREQNLGVVIINSSEALRNDEESAEAMQQYAKEQDYKWHYVVDKNSEVADAFGATRTPECYLFNKNLKLAYHGAIDDNPAQPGDVKREHLKEAINEMISGKSVAVNETRSVGCSIKR